jgi:excinuclease ABC subunit C
MKKCLAPCVNKCSQSEYATCVDQTVQFLKGNQTILIDSLKEKMHAASEKLEFEKAHSFLKTIQRLEHIQENNKSLVHSNRINLDALGFYRHLGDVVMTKLCFREGKLLASDHFFFQQVLQDDDQLLTQFILQHYQLQKDFPKEILVPFHLADSAIIAEIVKETSNHTIKIQCPEKSEKKQIIDLASKNAKSMIYHHCEKNQLQESLLLELQKHCHLTRFPLVIECFDTSNLSGDQAVASMVTFVGAKKEPKLYRDFKIKSVAQDDYHAMYEVLHRRYTKSQDEHPLPDLIIVDGGKGQLGVATKVLKQLSIASCDVIALTKEEGRHDKGLSKERVFTPLCKEPIIFSERSPVLFLLQQIRDEAHRRAITFQRKRRSKNLITSELFSLPGIGPKKKAALLKKFGSVKGIKKASVEELEALDILTAKDIDTLIAFQKA